MRRTEWAEKGGGERICVTSSQLNCSSMALCIVVVVVGVVVFVSVSSEDSRKKQKKES
jgi:hypothetical protein